MLKQFIIKYKLTLSGAVLGAVGGYAYYYFVGCSTGTCAITSKPINSTFYGALLFGLAFNILQKENK